MNFSTVPQMIRYVAEKYSSKEAFAYKHKGSLVNFTVKEVVDDAISFAISLTELGIKKGDRVGLASENRIEWIISDFAINILGAVTVPVFPILSAKQEEFIFNDCNATAIIVSNKFQLQKITQIQDNLNSLRQIIAFEDGDQTNNLTVKSFSHLMENGKKIFNENERKNWFIETIEKVTEEDLQTLIYTSGTTGSPKGVMLTHKNVISNAKSAYYTNCFNEKDVSISYLPLCHAFEHTIGFYAFFAAGTKIVLAESLETVAALIGEVKPTIFTSVPKFLETVKTKIILNASKESPSKLKIFNWAVKVGIKWAKSKTENRFNPLLSYQYKIAYSLVLSKIYNRLGGNLKTTVVGGAALSDEVNAFFLALGIDVLQGYGLTEASPVVSVNLPYDNEIGTIGKALTNVQIRLADDGEILVKGPNIMKGYWKDDEASKAAIDDDGWLYTGDIGTFTKRGNLKITDRKKNIFVNSGGKNIAPQPIENLLKQSKYVDNVVLIGENKEYITALISPNFEHLKNLAVDFEIEYKSESELAINQKINEHIKRDFEYLLRDLSKFEKVRKFTLLPKAFTIEEGELSPKLSVKRHVVEKKYMDLIVKMYE